MTDLQIKNVKMSWGLVIAQVHNAGELFYESLFDKHPEVQHLFKKDMKEQAKKLIFMISSIVTKLDKIDEVADDIKKLAVRHVHYGVEDGHYEVVGSTLLKILEAGLGSRWNDDLKESWHAAYNLLAGAMIEASKEARTLNS